MSADLSALRERGIAVETDAATLERLSADIAGPAAHLPIAVVGPASVEELEWVMRLAVAQGLAIVPRGGGMSYTGGYGPTRADSVLLDLRRLKRIEVHAGDHLVIADAGCTWAEIDEALAPQGLRLASFGPLSGIAATIGGGLSQHTMFFGAATAGLAGDAVLGLEVILASGERLGTGALARDGLPFFRQIAPDLTGLFLGDAGAFGVKVRAALRTVPRPTAECFATFAYPTLAAMMTAQIAICRLGLAAECYGFDAVANRHLGERGFGAAGTVQIATEIARASRSPMAAAKALLQAGANRLSAPEAGITLHVAVEAETIGVAESRLASIRAVAGGRDMADTIPRVTRARPFRRIRALLGPHGQNWLPVHGIAPLSQASAVLEACGAFLAERAALFAFHRIEVSLLTSAGPGFILIEPQFFWFDALSPMLRDAVLPEQLAAYGDRVADASARSVVFEARRQLRDVLDLAGCVHIQPGKYYRPPLAPAAQMMLAQIKTLLDPENRMNPGALFLP